MATTAGRSPATFSFFELLDRTFRIYRENFAMYVGLVAIVLIPISIISFLLTVFNLSAMPNVSTTSRASTGALAQYTGAACLSVLVALVLVVIEVVVINGSLTYAASENYLGR